MKDPRWNGDLKRGIHVVVGLPDGDCPLCRAAGFVEDPDDPVEELDEAELRALEDLLACRCPLCRPAPRGRRA
jgi:hypothetical protein